MYLSMYVSFLQQGILSPRLIRPRRACFSRGHLCFLQSNLWIAYSLTGMFGCSLTDGMVTWDGLHEMVPWGGHMEHSVHMG